MGLISCPKCGEPVSERAALCPHCDEKLIQPTLVMCEECGNEYKSTLPACTKCGCPNSHLANALYAKKRNRKTTVVISVILLLIFLLGLGVLQAIKSAIYYESKNTDYKNTDYKNTDYKNTDYDNTDHDNTDHDNEDYENKYYENMETITYTMINGAADAERACNLTIHVWYNAIYEKHDEETDKYTIQNGQFVDDFNDALSNLFDDDDFIQSISEIQDNQYEVISLMKKLKNPPEKYEDAYSELQIYYDNYMKLTTLAISPSGSYKSVSEDFNTYNKETVYGYQKMLLYLN